jgi:hypothetical protein
MDTTRRHEANRAVADVRVSAWGELPAERTLAGCIRVLIGGQSAGGAERVGTEWRATWFTAAFKDRFSVHATAEDAVTAVIRSGWARHLGARKTSPVTWTAKARHLAAGVSR